MSQDYQRIEQLLIYLETHSQAQPSLAKLAKLVELSSFYLQKLFKAWAGVTPKQYLKLATRNNIYATINLYSTRVL